MTADTTGAPNEESAGSAEQSTAVTDRSTDAEPLRVLFVSLMDLAGRSGGNIATRDHSVTLRRYGHVSRETVIQSLVLNTG